MDVTITPRKLTGTVTPPPSKSQAHRLLIAAALGEGVSTVRNVEMSQDIEATLRCLTALGGHWDRDGREIVVTGIGGKVWDGELPHLDCGESGSTLRFFIPIALAVAGGGMFTGRGRLMERPQQPYFDLFGGKGIFYEQKDGVLTVRGTLTPGEYRLPGNVSSQFVTGLLYALPLLPGDSGIVLTTPLESRAYVDMTLNVLEQSGVTVENQNWEAFHIPGGQRFQAHDLAVEADWSQAGFWYAANFLDNRLDILGLDPRSAQGDMAVSDLYWKLARPGEVDIDMSGIPDLVPPLAVMAAVRSGTTMLSNAARLRMKESDRLATTAALVNALGGQAAEGPDTLTIHGVPSFAGGTVDGANDHRIVMAAAIAATACERPVTILGAEAVQKSYPSFWEEYARLGGDIHVL